MKREFNITLINPIVDWSGCPSCEIEMLFSCLHPSVQYKLSELSEVNAKALYYVPCRYKRVNWNIKDKISVLFNFNFKLDPNLAAIGGYKIIKTNNL